MARYRKVDVRVHGDERVLRLSRPAPNGYSLWMYLLTCPFSTSIPGLFRAGEAALAEDIGWPLEGFRKAFREVLQEGLAIYDENARVVWLPKATRYNPPESPNVVKGWRVPWDELPNCMLKEKAYQSLKGFTEGLGEAFHKDFLKACPQPFGKSRARDPEQEQEQEQEQESSVPGSYTEGTLETECAEVKSEFPSALPPVLEFPVVGTNGRAWGVTQAAIDAWAKDFPTIDVLSELRKAHAWLEAHSDRRKTVRGMPKFCVGWLTRATDAPRRGSNSAKTAQNAENLKRYLGRREEHRAHDRR